MIKLLITPFIRYFDIKIYSIYHCSGDNLSYRSNFQGKVLSRIWFETLKSRRWFQKLFLLKNNKNESSSIESLFPKASTSYSPRNSINVTHIKSNHSFFENIFFRKRILEFIRPLANSTLNVAKSLGLTYLTRLRVGFRHLREHKFRHSFWDSRNPICECGNLTEST